MWEPRSFDVCENTATPIITILGHLELDMEVSDVGMELMESDDCRRISRKNGDANGVLATTQKEVRFSHKDGQKFINLFIQSISGLYQVS